MKVLKKLFVFSTLGQMSMDKNKDKIGKGHSIIYIQLNQVIQFTEHKT